jgi:hypothetical protein
LEVCASLFLSPFSLPSAFFPLPISSPVTLILDTSLPAKEVARFSLCFLRPAEGRGACSALLVLVPAEGRNLQQQLSPTDWSNQPRTDSSWRALCMLLLFHLVEEA